MTTGVAQAQREFDDGLLLLYAFNPEEATYHFQAAARLDPGLAMAYWGIGIAAGPNVNTDYDLARAAVGRAAAAQARTLDRNASPLERALIDALGKRYAATDVAGILPAETAYADAMRQVAARFPDDPTVQTLAAESLMDLTPLDYFGSDGRPGRNTDEIVRDLHDALKHDPGNVGANHYLIHVFEFSPTPAAGRAGARRLASMTFPPGAEHLAHMPAHIDMRIGDFDGAIAASLRAAAMFRRYVSQEHSDVHNPYYHHDLQVLDYAYMMSGQWARARDVATEVARQVGDNGAAVEAYLRFHRWREILALPPPAQPGVRWNFAVAMAQAATGDRADAQTTLDALRAAGGSDPRSRIAQHQLAAELAIADKSNARAIDELRAAVRDEDALKLKEPPAWYYPIRETLGARLALAHRDREAQAVFEDELRRDPDNPRALFGLATVLRRSDAGRARTVETTFRSAWRHADVRLTLDDL